MKQFKFLLVAIAAIALTSCGNETGTSLIKGDVVVSKVMSHNSDDTTYAYRVEFQSDAGTSMFLTNYKYEVGDSLFSKYQLKSSDKYFNQRIDSLESVNSALKKKNDELLYYNELLLGIIKEKSN